MQQQPGHRTAHSVLAWWTPAEQGKEVELSLDDAHLALPLGGNEVRDMGQLSDGTSGQMEPEGPFKNDRKAL